MVCPYCRQEMQKGRISNRGEVVCWIPENERKGWARWSTSPNGVALAKYSLFDGSEAIAYYCKPCGKVIVDIAENKQA